MITLIFGIGLPGFVFLCAGLWLWRLLTGHFAWMQYNHWSKSSTYRYMRPDKFDWVTSGIGAAIVVVSWPFWLWLALVLRGTWRIANFPVRRGIRIGAEREAYQRETVIKALANEREHEQRMRELNVPFTR